jgi:hypothetical protein
MSRAAMLLVVALSLVPRAGSAQVSVTSPSAGTASSYRNTTISWNPIPAASSYHLEIDDDPNFGSPEVDVTVAGTSYALSGQRLRLNGQQSWAAYVRINGTRWNANTFTPSYFGLGDNAALAVTSQNLVFLAFHGARSRIHLTSSNDWSMKKGLSLEDTFNADPVHLAVDEFDVAHAFWTEQRPTENRVPYYTSSAIGWDLVRIPGTVDGCGKGSSFAARGQFQIFLPCNPNEITRWTITNGTQFARTVVPNTASTDSASAVRDGVGNVYVASTRVGAATDEFFTVLQGSGDGFIPHIAAAGRSPTVAVTQQGELHALRWGWEQRDFDGSSMPFLYSNSLRGFQTWTALPIRSANFFRAGMPLIVDATRGRLYASIYGNLDTGLQICSAAHTGLASSTGTSWTCAPMGAPSGTKPASALGPDGTLHLAWTDLRGLGYANSLGSFLATNLTPQVSFGAASSTPSAAIVPAFIRDADGDDLTGQIQIGRAQTGVFLIEPSTREGIIGSNYGLLNDNNATLRNPSHAVEFRPMGSPSWTTRLRRDATGPLPSSIEARVAASHQALGAFELRAWDDTGATISQTDFNASVTLTYSGALPAEIDISSVPAGNAAVQIGAADGSSWGFGQKLFTKTTGQTRLLLTMP